MKKKTKAQLEFQKKFNQAAQKLGVSTIQPKPKPKVKGPTTQQKLKHKELELNMK